LFVDRNLWGFVVLIVVDFFIWLRVFVGLLVISWPSLSQSRHFWAFSVHSLCVIVVCVCVCGFSTVMFFVLDFEMEDGVRKVGIWVF
jgi:hypothetical protein